MKTSLRGLRVVAGVASTPVVGPNPDRVAVILSGGPAGTRQTYAFDAAAVLDTGLTLRDPASVVRLSAGDLGDGVSGPIFVISDVAGQVVGVTEVIRGA